MKMKREIFYFVFVQNWRKEEILEMRRKKDIFNEVEAAKKEVSWRSS